MHQELEEEVVCQMYDKEDRSFSAAGGVQVEARAREWPEEVMSALRIRAADTGHTLQILPAGTKPLPDLLDALKAVPSVGGGVSLIVSCAEVVKVLLECRMGFVTSTGNVPVPRRGLGRDCRAHMSVYGREPLRASDRPPPYRCSTPGAKTTGFGDPQLQQRRRPAPP